MNRLPAFDPQAARMERGVFLVLALAAVALIAITGWHGLEFAGSSEDLLRLPAAGAVARIESKKPNGSTNLTIYRPGPTGERSRPGGLERPKS